MEKYVLTQDLVTGNELIDSEHRKIFDEVNTLLDACSKGKGRENLSSLGEFLVEYVTKHFSDEEDLQKQSKYPEYTEHHKFHEWYKQKLGDAIIKLEQEGPTINSLGEINYMVSVLVKHIRETDRKLAQWIQNGAKNEVTASKVATGSAVSGKTSYMDTVTKDESTENLDIRQILDMKELQRIQDLFLTATGMTAAVVDMKGKYIIRGSSFTSFYSRYTSGKHNELREFTQDLTVGGFRAGIRFGRISALPRHFGQYPTPGFETRRSAVPGKDVVDVRAGAPHGCRVGRHRVRRKFPQEPALQGPALKNATLELSIKRLALKKARWFHELLQGHARLEGLLCQAAQFGLVDMIGENFKERRQ